MIPPCQKPNRKTKNYRVTLPNSAAFNFLNIKLCLSRVFERNFGLGEGEFEQTNLQKFKCPKDCTG